MTGLFWTLPAPVFTLHLRIVWLQQYSNWPSSSDVYQTSGVQHWSYLTISPSPRCLCREVLATNDSKCEYNANARSFFSLSFLPQAQSTSRNSFDNDKTTFYDIPLHVIAYMYFLPFFFPSISFLKHIPYLSFYST